ncbi:flagellin [Halosimplex pelagicum]|uniref:Flagellin n=1 Tax=Halosimplex pelagicum TaxID=869886 RepID=A0A7D5TE28_9EURY|nr:flagellin [Halosimplex pelagicum]QLH84289.1 flagellin [Halosimplex pelagicum]
MGFSVSGSAALIFAGLLIAFGMWHTAATNSFERVSEAQSDRSDGLLDQKNTAVVVDSASTADGDLTVEATNTGSTALSLNETDLLVDNEYRTGWRANATVDGDAATYLWLPGEQLAIEVPPEGTPGRVKLATEAGVSDTEVVA